MWPDPWRGLVDDAAIFPPGDAPLHEATRGVDARAVSGTPTWSARFVLRDTDVPLVRGFGAPLSVVVTGGAGPGRRPARRRGAAWACAVAAVEIALRDPDDPVGNVRRVIDARRDAAADVDVPVFVEIPGPATPAWLAAADEVAACGHRLKLRLGHVDHDLVPDAGTVAAWIDAALDRETPVQGHRRPPPRRTPRPRGRWRPRLPQRHRRHAGALGRRLGRRRDRRPRAARRRDPRRHGPVLGPSLVHLVRLLLGDRAPRRPDRPRTSSLRSRRMSTPDTTPPDLGRRRRRLRLRHRPPPLRRLRPLRRAPAGRRPHRRPGARPERGRAAADMVDTHAAVRPALAQPLHGGGAGGVGRRRAPGSTGLLTDQTERDLVRAGPPPVDSVDPAHALHRRRLRRLLRLRAPRLQRRPDVPPRPGAAAAQLEEPPRRLPRPLGHGRGLRHRRGPAVRASGRRPPTTCRRTAPPQRLDIEAELGFVVGVPSAMGDRVATADFARHTFGVVGLNDWSARDIQAWEYVPLGPVPGQVVRHVDQRLGHPAGAPSRGLDRAARPGPGGARLPPRRRPCRLDIDVEVVLDGEVVARPPYRTDVLVAGPDARAHHGQRCQRPHRRPVGLGHRLRPRPRPARLAAGAVLGRQGAVHRGRSRAHLPRGRRRGDAALLRARHRRRPHLARRGHRAHPAGPR